jgi:hypothetical protein
MRLQKQLPTGGNIECPKYVVIIPLKQIRETGWKEGIQLEVIIKDG